MSSPSREASGTCPEDLIGRELVAREEVALPPSDSGESAGDATQRPFELDPETAPRGRGDHRPPAGKWRPVKHGW